MEIEIIMKNRNYTKLLTFKTFEERFLYLKLSGNIGYETFGSSRWINQKFYMSSEWRRIRDEVIIRDNGMDLGIEGYPIYGKIYIHHMNPITENDILAHSAYLVDPEFLICVSSETHNAIHYGNFENISKDPIIRFPNDTIPWKKETQYE